REVDIEAELRYAIADERWGIRKLLELDVESGIVNARLLLLRDYLLLVECTSVTPHLVGMERGGIRWPEGNPTLRAVEACLARKSIEPVLTISFRGHEFRLGGKFALKKFAESLAVAVAPETTWETLDDPPRALRLAAEYLAARHEVNCERLQRCFERIVDQASRCPAEAMRHAALVTGRCRGRVGCSTAKRPRSLGFLKDEDLVVLPARLAVTDL
ncbi:MAG: hypothetical protein WKF75_11345, partial [Singulisphaera sp.]